MTTITTPASTHAHPPKKASRRKPRATTPANTVPVVLSELDLECERIADELRVMVNITALAETVSRTYTDMGAASRVDHVVWELADAALCIHDFDPSTKAAARSRIVAAVQLPREEFEVSLDMVCPESGRGWDVALLMKRHPNVIINRIFARIAQLRSAFVVVWAWDPDEEATWEDSCEFIPSWLDKDLLYGAELTESLAGEGCRQTGEVVTLDSHIHATPLPDNDDDAVLQKSLVFIADAGQLRAHEASIRARRKSESLEPQAAE